MILPATNVIVRHHVNGPQLPSQPAKELYHSGKLRTTATLNCVDPVAGSYFGEKVGTANNLK